MQDNYEEDLSEKEKAIVREMCNVITPLSSSRGFFCGLRSTEEQGSAAYKPCLMRDPQAQGKSGGSADHCFGYQ